MQIKFKSFEKFEKKYNNLVLFDGTCNLCNWWVDLIIKFDKKKSLNFIFYKMKSVINLLKCCLMNVTMKYLIQ